VGEPLSGGVGKSEKQILRALRNADFLDDRAARPLRILAEYLEPQWVLERRKIRNTIAFFGSARIGPPGNSDAAPELAHYFDATRELARRLTEWSLKIPKPSRRYVVCSGGGPGLMEATNQGAAEAGGETLGLGIALPHEQGSNRHISPGLDLQFHYFFMRKFWFSYLAKAIVVMPGGFGTLDELMEMLTLAQTEKKKNPPPLVLFGTAFWDEVLDFSPMVRLGTISPEDVELFYKTDSVDDAFAHITSRLDGPP